MSPNFRRGFPAEEFDKQKRIMWCKSCKDGRHKKRGYRGGWARKHHTWEHGPRPARFGPGEQMTLLEILDKDHTIGGEPVKHWTDWKNTHPEIFGAQNDG